MSEIRLKADRRDWKNSIRAEWVGRQAEGASSRQIAEQYQASPSTVLYTLRKTSERVDHESEPLSGRPRKTIRLADRLLQREAIKNG